jgi:hypothetical protein
MTATSTYGFGSGSVICVANGNPTKIGTLQDIEVDISASTVELMGQNQYAEAIARGPAKIEGKAKTGKIDLKLFNNIYLGSTLDTTGFDKIIESEAASVPGSGPYTVQVTGHTGFIADLGVYYADGTGQLTAGTVAAGKYTVDASTGTYTFHSSDTAKALLFSYIYKPSTGNNLLITNTAMGLNPVFALYLQNGYTTVSGVTYTNLRLYSCVASKITFPFKNSNFMVSDLDFSAFADSSGNVFQFGVGT